MIPQHAPAKVPGFRHEFDLILGQYFSFQGNKFELWNTNWGSFVALSMIGIMLWYGTTHINPRQKYVSDSCWFVDKKFFQDIQLTN